MDRREFRRRLASRPRAVRFEELERLLHLYGWSFARSKGSHFVFVRDAEQIVVPFQRGNVSPAYVREVLSRVEGEDDD